MADKDAKYPDNEHLGREELDPVEIDDDFGGLVVGDERSQPLIYLLKARKAGYGLGAERDNSNIAIRTYLYDLFCIHSLTASVLL